MECGSKRRWAWENGRNVETVRHRDVVIVGGGPAGLSAAIETATAGADTLLVDENRMVGGQLFKQIHKFFGSQRHRAGTRGFRIGEELMQCAMQAGVETFLDTVVWGIFDDRRLALLRKHECFEVSADAIVIATGASENALSFPGWTLPGVMSAGAAQTMVNVHRVLPGRRVLMVGSGNVGVIVAYQLMQAGAEVVSIIDAKPQVGSYAVHAAKVRRLGVPIRTSHTILEAVGREEVTEAIIAEVNSEMEVIPGTEKRLPVDMVCLAVGLTPLMELAHLAGCESVYIPALGGYVPVHNECMETTVPGIYVAGDITGIEEATTAIEEGRLAGLAIVEGKDFGTSGEATTSSQEIWRSLQGLRLGQFGDYRARAKELQIRAWRTGNGLSASPNGQVEGRVMEDCVPATEGRTGSDDMTHRKPKPCGIPSTQRLERGPIAIIECTQDIPCNPCEAACPHAAICVADPLTNLPVLDEEKCIGCGLCIASCPGLAIFVIDWTYSDTEALVSVPHEFLPIPAIGDEVEVTDSNGHVLGQAVVVQVQAVPAFDGTMIVKLRVPKGYAEAVRAISPQTRKGPEE